MPLSPNYHLFPLYSLLHGSFSSSKYISMFCSQWYYYCLVQNLKEKRNLSSVSCYFTRGRIYDCSICGSKQIFPWKSGCGPVWHFHTWPRLTSPKPDIKVLLSFFFAPTESDLPFFVTFLFVRNGHSAWHSVTRPRVLWFSLHFPCHQPLPPPPRLPVTCQAQRLHPL